MQEPLNVATTPTPLSHRSNPAAAALRLLLILTAAIGWWISFDLIRLSGGLGATNPLLASQCDPQTSNHDCFSVLASPQASFRPAPSAMPIPWSVLGAGYFAFIAVWFLFIGIPQRGAFGWHLWITFVVAAGAAVSVHLLNVMGNSLKSWCVFCVAAHIVNAAVVLLTLLGFVVRKSDAPPGFATPRPSHALATALAGFLLFQGHILFAVAYRISSQSEQVSDRYRKIITDPDFARWSFDRQEPRDLTLPPDAITVGPEGAPHTLHAFIDLQCESCKKASETIRAAATRHRGALRLVIRHFPQDPACNNLPIFRRGGHRSSCDAARYVEAIRRVVGPEAAYEFVRFAYEKQAAFSPAALQNWATEMGLDSGKINTESENEAVRRRIADDIASGQSLGVQSVPALFLDGRRLEYWSLDSTWDALLDDVVPAAP